MTLVISNMVPGILVHLSTNIRGNVRYSAQVIEPEHVLGLAILMLMICGALAD